MKHELKANQFMGSEIAESKGVAIAQVDASEFFDRLESLSSLLQSIEVVSANPQAVAALADAAGIEVSLLHDMASISLSSYVIRDGKQCPISGTPIRKAA